jgi:hypothetical protein
MPSMQKKEPPIVNKVLSTAIVLCGAAAAALAGCTGSIPSLNPAPSATSAEQNPTDVEADLPPEAETATPAGPTATPTAITMPTAQPAQATESSSTDITAPDSIPTLDSTAEAQSEGFGTAPINILQPGQFSRIISPIRVIANVQTGDDLQVQMALYGEDGRVVANKTLYANPYDDPLNGNFITDIEFSIPVLAEAGRLELKVLDQFGRIKALNSVNLILLSTPPNDRNYAPEGDERIQLQLPFPGQTEIEGSPLLVSGLVRTEADNPLDIWLMDESGTTLGKTAAAVVFSPGSEYGQFIGEITYEVSQPTRVLMILAISDSRIPGYTYVKSLDLLLTP